MKIEIYSDIGCPWCYIGKRRLEQALRGFEHRDEVAIEWRSFELAPDMPATSPLDTAQYLTSAKGIPPAKAQELIAHCTQIGAAEGLELRFDRLKLFNTRKAHQLLHFAKTAGLQAALKERLFRAAFTEGREIGQIDVLVELASEVGLDPTGAREALEAEHYLPAVLDDEDQAQALGARGVPYFLINDKYALSGAQSSETFKEMLETVWREEHPVEMLAGGDDAAACGADGCAL